MSTPNDLTADLLLELEDAACTLASRAGAMALERWSATRRGHWSKSNTIDLVTQTDIDVQHLIATGLAERFPKHRIVAEEGDLARMPSEADQAGIMWIIDPIDGTMNFVHGHEQFGISIGCCHNGRPVAGAVLRPATGDLFSARLGGGARCNGRRIAVSETLDLGSSLAVTGFGYDHRENPGRYLPIVEAFLRHCQDLRRFGSAALDLCEIARGTLDVYGELDLKPWDVAAGRIIVEEAGGRVTTLTGEAIPMAISSILATNGRIHEAARAILHGCL
jgi:myo-inositol-1(or 4)-monophosphatase